MKKILAALFALFALNTGKAQTNDTLAHTLLWKITGNGLQAPSYLYGTMHTGDDRVFRLQDSALIAFDAVSAFAMEINMDSIDAQSMSRQMMLPQDQTIKDLIGEDDYKLAQKLVPKRTGLPMFLMNKVKPIFLYSALLEGKQGKKDNVLDIYYFKLAKKQNKHISGLEKVEDQMNLLGGITMDKQVAMLKEVLRNFPQMQKEMDESTNAYASADLNKMLEETEKDTSMGKDFSEVFLHKRNKVMAHGMEHIMRSGQTLFTAVGAAHLPGQQGIINLLKQDGYTVSPVLSKKYLSPKDVKKRIK